MQPLKISLLVTITFIIASCGEVDQFDDEGLISENTYTSEEIGWTMEIPEGWNLISENVLSEGKDLVDDAGIVGDWGGAKNLLNLENDDGETFVSVSQPFVISRHGEWKDGVEPTKQLTRQAIASQGVPVESSETRKEEIDGVIFEVYDFAINGGEFRQTYYTSLRNNLGFSVILSYQSEKTRNMLLKAWRNSKFNK